MAHNPLEFLYEQFTAYVEDRRREPRDDVLTGLATATFPDGSTPEVIDVVRIAANLFAAGQETTIRLLGTIAPAHRRGPELQQRLRDERALIPNFVEECLRYESPVKGDFRLSRVPTTVGGVDLPAGTTVMVLNGAANRDPRKFEYPEEFDVDRAERRASTWPSGTASTSAPAPPWPGPRAGSRSSGCSTGWPTSGSPRPSTARPVTAATSTPRPSSSAACRSSTWSSRPSPDPSNWRPIRSLWRKDQAPERSVGGEPKARRPTSTAALSTRASVAKLVPAQEPNLAWFPTGPSRPGSRFSMKAVAPSLASSLPKTFSCHSALQLPAPSPRR